MPEVANTQSHSQDLHLTLNSDGRRHPILNIAAVFSFAAGVAAFACGLIVGPTRRPRSSASRPSPSACWSS